MKKKRNAFHTRGHGTAGPRAIKPRGTTPRWRDGSPGCSTPGSAWAAGGVAAALVQPVFHRSRAFPAHLVLLVPSAFSARRLWSYETLGSGFCAPEKSSQPLAVCCRPPPASPWVTGEAGTVLPAQGGLRAWLSVTRQPATSISGRRTWCCAEGVGAGARPRWALRGLLQAAWVLPRCLGLPWLPVIARCPSPCALIGFSRGYLRRMCTARRAT